MKTLKSYYLDKSKKFAKSVIVWGEIKVQETENNRSSQYYIHAPLMYIRKPKWLSQDKFDILISNMILNAKQDMELENDQND
jgi:hypothetical protein